MFLFSVYSALLYPHFVFPPWTLSSWLCLFKWIESAAWSDLCPLAPHRVIGRGKVVNRVLKYNPQFRFSYPPPTSQLGEMIGNARKNLRAAEKSRLQIDLCDKVWQSETGNLTTHGPEWHWHRHLKDLPEISGMFLSYLVLSTRLENYPQCNCKDRYPENRKVSYLCSLFLSSSRYFI